MSPRVSILITTYNRSTLLWRAAASVLGQTFEDLELVIVDDCSTDDTPTVVGAMPDKRIRYTRMAENVGGQHGDVELLRRFVADCRAEFFLYLCDDDYLIPTDLLARAVVAMDAHPGLAIVQGGAAQHFPPPGVSPDFTANAPYLRPQISADRLTLFTAGLFPTHLMPAREYLSLYAADPANRNIVTGATLYRTETFRKGGALDRAIKAGVKWQAGYAMSAGAAMSGDVLYLDEPCVMTEMSATSASLRGTQRGHLFDALASIDAAFNFQHPAIRDQMARAVLMIYVRNKIGHKLGWFRSNALGDISAHFEPPISGQEFLHIADYRCIPLTDQNRHVIALSDGPLSKDYWPELAAMAA